MDPDRVFAGVDLSAGRRGPGLAVLTSRLDVRSLKRMTPEEAAEEIASFDGIAVAIGSPLRLCREDASPDPSIDPHPQVGRSRHIRSAEKELARRGITVRKTPVLESAAPAGMRIGFELARNLAARGFSEGREACGEARSFFEVHPAACATVLLGRQPFGRGTLEGRIQRQLALLRERVALPDPMDALEELTAHHILSGRLSLEGILAAGELDALLAAFTAWRAGTSPDSVSWLGSDADGWICLPAAELQEKYSK
jgi:predicted nuclease with RNAse H fold